LEDAANEWRLIINKIGARENSQVIQLLSKILQRLNPSGYIRIMILFRGFFLLVDHGRKNIEANIPRHC
jgi:hypothetical protein